MEKLFQDDLLFESAFNYAAIGMALVSPEGKWLKVNRSLSHLLGYTQEELLKIDFQTLTHPDDLSIDLGLVKEMLDGVRDTYQLDKRYFHKSGSICWVTLSVSLIKNKDGSPRFFISQIQNITKRKMKEEQVSLVVSSTMDGYWDWHIKDDYEYMSPRFWKIFGFEDHEKKHHPSEWQKLIFEEDLPIALNNFEKHVATKGQHPFTQEVRYKHKNGSTVWIICQGKVIEWDADGSPIRMVGTHTDITSLKTIQRELEDQKDLQAHSARLISLGQLAGGIAHEINNPLAIIAGQADVLERCINKVEVPRDRLKKSVQSIKDTVDRIAKVINGLKTFSRDGRNDEIHEIKVIHLIDDVLSLCRDRFKRHDVDVDITGVSTQVTVFANKTQIGQVLINLINNSTDAIAQLDKKWVKLSCEESAQHTKLIVEDSGQGIPLATQKNMMKPFFTTKKIGEGTGIGLSICKNIIEKHYGELIYDSSAPHTRFVIILPKKSVQKRTA